MRGLLIYDREGYQRNEWFICRMQEVSFSLGCNLELVIYEDDVEKSLSPLPDFAIVRTIHPELNEKLEKLGIPTYNNSTTSRIANDKWQTYLLARELGIEVMDTALVTDVCYTSKLTYPTVIKTVDGHGGSEVFLAENADKCKQILSQLANRRVISQQLCNESGVDMRVYVMGDDIIAATKRTSKNDFRSNFSLGGNAEPDAPTKRMISIIKKLRQRLGFDFVGVDFIRHNGSWVLNEIEDVVGTRMLYSLTDIDAAALYISYIIEKTKCQSKV